MKTDNDFLVVHPIKIRGVNCIKNFCKCCGSELNVERVGSKFYYECKCDTWNKLVYTLNEYIETSIECKLILDKIVNETKYNYGIDISKHYNILNCEQK